MQELGTIIRKEKWVYRGHRASNLQLQDKSRLTLLATSVPARRVQCHGVSLFVQTVFYSPRPARCQIAHVSFSPFYLSTFSYRVLVAFHSLSIVFLRRDTYPNEERIKSCRTVDCGNQKEFAYLQRKPNPHSFK